MGIGLMELLLLVILGVVLIGVPVGIVLLILFLNRRRGGRSVADLEAENRRLRDELDERGEQR